GPNDEQNDDSVTPSRQLSTGQGTAQSRRPSDSGRSGGLAPGPARNARAIAARQAPAGTCPGGLGARRLARRRLHRRARQRERPRLRTRPAPAVLRRLLGRPRRGLLREDLVLGLAGEEPLELVLVDRLALDQDRRELVELVHVLLEHARGEVVRVLDDAAD